MKSTKRYIMSKIYTVIAAGGLGTRLQNFRGSNTTKMLLEINGESMISKQLKQLISWNLDEFIVITNPIYDNLIRDDLKEKMENTNIKVQIIDPVRGNNISCDGSVTQDLN